jgi:ectoine hydroxylase-related dioxygenase (phytanoyl-CoA dioxygenase family)
MSTKRRMTVGGREIPPQFCGELVETGDPRDVSEAVKCDGYALLRGVLPRDEVLAARSEILRRLASVGEIAEPIESARATGTSRRRELAPDPNAFWRSVSETPTLRRVSHGGELAQVFATLFGEPAVPFDFLWLRTMPSGRASPLHFDHVYMNRGSSNVLTTWIPLGDAPLEAGPILVVENSHRFDDLIARYRGRDVDRDGLPGSFPEDAIELAASRGARLLSTDFRAGDVLVFDMFTLHGSADNRLTGGEIRLSCDVRWQPASDARDDRWFGSPPPGHGGMSYGGMNAAKPLGADYIRR